MPDSNYLRLIYLFYSGTIAVNIVIAMIQFATERDRARKLVISYWSSLIASALANGIFKENGLPLVFVSFSATWINQFLLGSVLASVLGRRVPWIPMALFHGAAILLGLAFYLAGADFAVYATPIGVGSVSPWFFFAWHSLRERRRPLSVMQRLFVGTATLMSLHYLDWAWFRTRPELFLVGSLVAFAILHVLSLLIPSVLVEHTLFIKNERLEEEVRQRADQLTATREELWNTNKLASIGRMAGGIAHELNNSLSLVTLHVDRIRFASRQGTLTTELVSDQVVGVHRAVRRISMITESLRKLARDRMVLRRTRADVRELMRSIVEAHRDWLVRSEIRLEMDFEEGDWTVDCDAYEISQAFSNLLRNAIEAAESTPIDGGRWVRIRAGLGDRMRIAVEDCGRLAPEIAERVMDPFFTTKGPGGGLGLGLSVSRAIAEQHGGSLVLDPGFQTTCFVLSLPRKGGL